MCMGLVQRRPRLAEPKLAGVQRGTRIHWVIKFDKFVAMRGELDACSLGINTRFSN